MQYGYFDDENREYVITRPDTPLPWINYLGVDAYCALMSNTAGGYSFYRDAANMRILRYRYNNVPSDRPGRYVYIRDNVSKDYWSASWQPTNKDLKKYKYECAHGLSYTKIKSLYSGISSETLYFVPIGENLEIWKLKLKNQTKRKRSLSLFTYVEFCLWDALNDMTDFQYNLNIGQTAFKNNAMYHITLYNVAKKQFAYFWSNTKVSSYDGVRQSFVGPYRSESNPIAVENGKCSNSIACGWAPFGGLNVNVELEAGEEKEVVFILGYSENMGDELNIFKKYKNPKNVEKALSELRSYWDANLEKFRVTTPDPNVNSMANIWNQYQCMTTFNWSRSASYYEAGGERGMGFRDSNQDTLGFVHQIPEKVRKRLMDIASVQFPEGRAMHQYSPLTKKGNKEGYGDDHLWLVQAVTNYIKETGDYDFLDEVVAYNDEITRGSMYDHIVKAIEYSWNNTGYHGLTKAGNADWNDCLNLSGPKHMAVSIMIAEMFVYNSNLLSKLAEKINKNSDAEKFKEMSLEMKHRINDSAWDGEWYLRAFDDDGKPVGTNASKEGKIWLETQTWAILSGVAEGERAIKTMDSVNKFLYTKYGIVLFYPAYSEYHKELGYVSVFPRGLKENASIFCHTNPWAMIAEAMLGRGETAFKYYKTILPTATNDIAHIHWTEPYVYSQMIAGKEHKDFGQAKNSWLTGAAAWNFITISQHILGIKPDYDGLIIDPCIPKTWKGFSVNRIFRGTTYNIEVKNPAKVNRGVKKMIVDNVEIKGNKIPLLNDNKEHKIKIILG